jgi:lipid-binding SYLF domain-containing protein
MLSPRHITGLLSLVIGCALLNTGCRAAKGAQGSTPEEQRSVIQTEAHNTLDKLYAAQPDAKDKIAKAAGWGYFSTVNVNVLLLSSENGYGVVHNNSDGKDTYMKMAGAGVGVGMGLKDYRAIFVFTDPAVMHKFVMEGWNAGGQADAAAKTKSEGGAANVAAEPIPGMQVYQFTEQGVALQATVQGSKYWRDEKLNSP